MNASTEQPAKLLPRFHVQMKNDEFVTIRSKKRGYTLFNFVTARKSEINRIGLLTVVRNRIAEDLKGFRRHRKNGNNGMMDIYLKNYNNLKSEFSL